MKSATPITLPTMSTVSQAAAATGLPESMLRKLIQAGTVKHVRSGRKIYVNLDSLSAYLSTGDDPLQPTVAQYENHELKKEFANDEAKN